jgi:dihydrofolate reductase
MRNVIVCNVMSLDGYYAGPGNNVMALAPALGGAFDAYNAERLRAAGTLLLGRVSYDGFRGFWPSVADDPAVTPDQREISRLDNAIDKVVISDSLAPGQTEPWRGTTRIIGRASAHEQIAELKRQAGKDILIFASRTLWNDLLAHGLVDELHLMIGPIVLGAGVPLFDGLPQAPLRLIDTRTWDGSDNVLVRYAVRHESAQANL